MPLFDLVRVTIMPLFDLVRVTIMPRLRRYVRTLLEHIDPSGTLFMLRVAAAA